MRIAGRIKMGYYPTPPAVSSLIRRWLSYPKDEATTLLDPCCGCGTAAAALAEGADVRTSGIELDEARAETAAAHLGEVRQGAVEDALVPEASFGVLLLNPPYDDEDGTRKEFRFLKLSLGWLAAGGVLVYIIPEKRLTRGVAKYLTQRCRSLRLWRFPDEDFAAFGQVVVMGVRKERESPDESEALRLVAGAERGAPGLEAPTSEEEAYRVPAGEPVTVALGASDPRMLAELAARSPLSARVREEICGLDRVELPRPPGPLHSGHVGLLLASGYLDGVVGDGRDRHLIVGGVVKEVVTSREEEEDATVIRKTEQLHVRMKMLDRDGRLRILT